MSMEGLINITLLLLAVISAYFAGGLATSSCVFFCLLFIGAE